jgi:hypothetical protein
MTNRTWIATIRVTLVSLVAVLGATGFDRALAKTVPLVPTMSSVVTGPGLAYPDPPVSIVSGAIRVEDFPYRTEEYFVSGTANGAPYATRIIVRRPTDVNAFSGVVVSEALHAGGRSLSSSGPERRS